ncbi:Nucleotidyl transferase AbiEii toxin, Type IV TA system [Pseudobutyrivibrio sp. YE44]|uniref:nucleotidyl transferase AbiEii/AbiGii toxin family protein n=1 Tax=Pseudobutyrivibrio sp. YE44 TaxID=1520802 RepID=UPI00087F62BF|nr:nucleotidyl transferase AbiEii/AbiGii toxin family protein [Pseudobutyrivibrio sp. YE44]SDB55635.1 Nucleotidyl transferase AbiEii toxin, Type IV TA system [Pseudobutyrivibrio sp. YE44]
MYLHEDKELFADVIALTAERTGQAQDIIEKDYYVTIILKELSESDYPICFKGGTSLSKAYGVIDRFSEDIDITFTEHIGVARRKKLKYEILGPVADKLGLKILNWDDIESNKEYNHYDYGYKSIVEDSFLTPFVKLETALMSYAFPTEEQLLSNYIYEALKDDESELIADYDLAPFSMQVQSLKRTLIDKIFATCDYYLQGKAARNSRHLYDIYKLAQHVEIDDSFKALIPAVREHRLQMKNDIAPSADSKYSIPDLIKEYCDKDFYKSDYELTTLKLITDAISYDETKDFVLKFTRKIFK